MRILLIRHGQTPSNIAGLLDTRVPGPGLTELGHKQAAAIPGVLAGESVGAIYASVQVRTGMTAAPLAEALGLEVNIREGLREVESGELEMLGDPVSVRAYMDACFAWADGDVERRMPGGESGREVFARFDSALEEAYRTGHSSVAIFSHGAVIRSWAGARTENLSADFIAENSLGNTGVVVIEGSPEGGWRALSWMGEPIGGHALDDSTHEGPTGETVATE